MGDVVALRSDHKAIYDLARALTWKSLTRIERSHVLAVERDPELAKLYHDLELDARKSHWFTVPKGYSAFETAALNTTHRFADELACHMLKLQEVKDFVADYQYRQHHMPA